jgi:hypothetical protein
MSDNEKTDQPDVDASSEEIAQLNAAFVTLFDGLREANRRFLDVNDSGRDGTIHAIEAMIKFLSRFAPVLNESLHVPLANLMNAMMSLDDGAVAPMLKPIRHRGQARASAFRESMIGAAAFAAKSLIDAGHSKSEAYSFVARTLDAVSMKASRGRFPSITASTVHKWHDNVAADIDYKGEAAKSFRELAVDPAASPAPGTSKEDACEFFGRHLAHVAPLIRAQENS